jgi:hypothetical protein
VRYEDLVTKPIPILKRLFEYLELPYQKVDQFGRFNILSGGDPKMRHTNRVHNKSVHRHRGQMPWRQQRVFGRMLRGEMKRLGYNQPCTSV